MKKDPDPKFFSLKGWKDVKCNAIDKDYGIEKAITEYAAAVKKVDDDEMIGKAYADLLKLIDKVDAAAKKIHADLKKDGASADLVKHFAEYAAKVVIEKKRLGDASKVAAKSLTAQQKAAKEEAQQEAEEEEEEDEGIPSEVKKGAAKLLESAKIFLSLMTPAEQAQDTADSGKESLLSSVQLMMAFEKDATEADMALPKWESLRGNFAAAGSSLVLLEKGSTKAIEAAETALTAAGKLHAALLKVAGLPADLRAELQSAAKAFV